MEIVYNRGFLFLKRLWAQSECATVQGFASSSFCEFCFGQKEWLTGIRREGRLQILRFLNREL
jgi:hypothetical protein